MARELSRFRARQRRPPGLGLRPPLPPLGSAFAGDETDATSSAASAGGGESHARNKAANGKHTKGHEEGKEPPPALPLAAVDMLTGAPLAAAAAAAAAAADDDDDGALTRLAPLPAGDVGALSRSSVWAGFSDGLALRDYQLQGARWLLYQWHQRRSCLLADEMGLGKTVQAVALLHALDRLQRNRGPHLVVVPLSTMGHWANEMAAWTDLKVLSNGSL
jgi:hypothetical protein